MTPEEQRTYRLDPLDRSGVFLGLGPGQLAVLATASLLGAVLLTVDAPIGIAGAPVVIGALVALSRVGNQRLVEWVPVVARFVARLRTNQYRWRAPLTPSHDHDASPAHRLPPCLHGVDVGDGRDGLGVVADTRADTRTAVLPVGSDEFVLLSREDQEQLLAGWGDVLAGFSAERSPVVRLCWSDYAAPRGLGDHARWAAAQAAPPRPAAWADYQALLSRASPWTVGHEVLLTVTVARSGLRARTATDGDLLDALGRAVDAIGRGLRSAGLHVGDPVSAQAIAAGIRSRAGGRCSTRTAVSLAERVGLVFAESAGP
ncbi:MAG TPA: SCO6880 family protein, partial [Acidimicrobiales bacterium]